ncbi:hypothetical protein LY78DRAFT_70264 [Colletotrichum sublineola]|nr:hypothetical protein LY78DRAFT_70264 [Colletotrichum sublineola]
MLEKPFLSSLNPKRGYHISSYWHAASRQHNSACLSSIRRSGALRAFGFHHRVETETQDMKSLWRAQHTTSVHLSPKRVLYHQLSVFCPLSVLIFAEKGHLCSSGFGVRR